MIAAVVTVAVVVVVVQMKMIAVRRCTPSFVKEPLGQNTEHRLSRKQTSGFAVHRHDGDRLLSKRRLQPRNPQPQRIEPVQLPKPGNQPRAIV